MTALITISLSDVVLEPDRSLALLVGHVDLENPVQSKPSLATRAVLCSVLAKLTGRRPEALQLETNSAGKPYLTGKDPIAFSLSHSKAHSLIALSLGGEIGCDIEDRFRDDDDVDELGAVVLHPMERQEMSRLAAMDRQSAFRRYWVRKEAVLKAAGSGFLKDPRAVIVGLERAQPTWDGVNGSVFNLHEKQLGPDCFAAVASADAACSWHLLMP